MAVTSAFATKKYLCDELDTLITDYNNQVVVTYGPTTQDMYSSTIEALGISWDSTDTYSGGATRTVNMETYSINFVVAVAQADGTCEDVEQSVYEIYQVVEDFVRDDLMETKLGGNVSFANVKPSSVQSAPLPNGGAGAFMEFNIECKKKIR
jgi:hypothetical protein